MIFIKFADGTVQTVDGDHLDIREQWIATLDDDRVTGLFDQGVVAFVAVTQRKKGTEA